MRLGDRTGTLLDEPPRSVVSTEVVGPASNVDIQEADSGAKLTPEQAHSFYTNAGPQQKAYLRTTLEILTFLGISAGYYYGTLGDRKFYEFEIGGDSLKQRFITGDAIRLDNNGWDTNVGHIAAGTGFYLLARSNDLGLWESLLITMGTSTVWEFFGELQDEVSINDAVMTPFGGFAIGETMYQLGEFFQHSSHTIPNQALGFLFGPSTAIHRWWDNTTPKAPTNVDKFGFTTDAWHRFRVFAGGGGSTSGDTDDFRGETEMGFDFEVVTAEKYGKPGEASIFYTDGVFNELAFKAAMDGTEIVDLRFFAKTAFLGHYQQNIRKDEASQHLEGHSLFLGLSSAFEYYAHVFSEMREEDKQAICDLVGPSLVADYYHRGFHLRASVDAYPTFSMVKPAAADLYDRNHSLQGVKSIYRSEGYYYAVGMTAAGRMEADYGPFGLEGQIRYHYFDSIEGHDRIQERVFNDIELEDQRLGLQLSLYYALPIENLKLALDVEKIYRWSDIDTLGWDTDETRFLARIVFEF